MDPDRLLPEIRRRSPLPPPPGLSEAIMGSIAAGNDPWLRGFQRFLCRWWPAGIVLAMIAAAWLVLAFPHGDHPAPPATALPDLWP
jgi:hypothetical protein